jgi:hypothetical protein
MAKFMLGADPEVFMKDASDAFMSAIGLIGGTKEKPRPLPIGPGFAVQEDNVALEYNIPPAASKEEFRGNINKIMSYLSDEIAQHGLKFVNVAATADFPVEQLLHPHAMVFGCDPDYNAWLNGKRNPRPKATDRNLRSCGGHVHIGHKFDDRPSLIQFIKYLDLYLAVPSMLQDQDDRRRLLYGKPGAFRYKPYGAEYRVLSNYWIFDNKYTDWVWDSVGEAMDAWQNNNINIDKLEAPIMDAIINNNKNAAEFLIDTYGLKLA